MEDWHKNSEEQVKDKFLKCDTQRSGKVATDLRLRLMQPDPLYFCIVSRHNEEKHKLLTLLQSHKDGYCMDDLEFRSNISRRIIYYSLAELLREGLIEKLGTKVKIYRVRNVSKI